MHEMENKEVGQIRFEFSDGTWFILDQQSLRHLKAETKLEIDFAISKAFEEIEAKRLEAEKLNSDEDLGINVKDVINTKDKMV